MPNRDDIEITIDSDNLAFPDIHIKKKNCEPAKDEDAEEGDVYDDVAIPELRVKKRK